MRIAAVIPLYNGAPYIRAALDSVFAQTVPPDEIIVVNDGSTDTGPDIVAQVAAENPLRPITVLSQANAGQSAARNAAIRHTTCTHIALLDQDDLWHEDHIEILRRPFLDDRMDRIAFTYGNVDRILADGRMLEYSILDYLPVPHPMTSLRQWLQDDLNILPGATLILKRAIEDAGYFDERLSGYEDDDLFLRLLTSLRRVEYINARVLMWRFYTTSTGFSMRMVRSRMIYFDKLLETFPDEPRLGLNWRRNVLAPRFLNYVMHDFIVASKMQDPVRLDQMWADVQTVVPHARSGVRARFALVRPLVAATYKGRLAGISRFLLRRSIAEKRARRIKRLTRRW